MKRSWASLKLRPRFLPVRSRLMMRGSFVALTFRAAQKEYSGTTIFFFPESWLQVGTGSCDAAMISVSACSLHCRYSTSSWSRSIWVTVGKCLRSKVLAAMATLCLLVDRAVLSAIRAASNSCCAAVPPMMPSMKNPFSS